MIQYAILARAILAQELLSSARYANSFPLRRQNPNRARKLLKTDPFSEGQAAPMDDRIIVIDDDPDYLEILRRRLTAAGYHDITVEADPVAAAGRFTGGERFHLALIDITMPDMNGMALLDRVKNTSPYTECIMVTAVNEVQTAVSCLRKGAYDYLVKPVSRENLTLSVNRALERKHLMDLLDIDKKKTLPRLTDASPFKGIVTRSRNVLKVLKEAELHAHSDVPILITGESGTGKELLAKAVHRASARAGRPMTTVNMAAVTESLFDAEFFGHAKGAFTGAEKARIGYLEHTDGGTLFLDEIGILPVALQAKLLRVLQDGDYMPIGTSTSRRSDVRIIAATNEDMEQLIEQKKFRQDLYYRLRGGWLHLPPLRERRADIPPLINLFLDECCRRGGRCRLDVQAMALLMNHDYPGNIRELKSIIQSAVNLAEGGPLLAGCLPAALRTTPSAPDIPACRQEGPALTLAQVEKNHILGVYHRLNENKSQTARRLDIGLNTLRRKLAAYGVK